MFQRASNYVGLWDTLGQIIGDPEKRIIMKVAVMQPYLFPYLGYFHLLDAVDRFVVLDDVKYPKNGWVNRNRILVNGSPVWFTVPVSSKSELISEKQYLINEHVRTRLQLSLSLAYSKSSNLSNVLPWLEELEASKGEGVVKANLNFLQKTMRMLGMSSPDIVISSDLQIDKGLRGQDKILEICSHLDCATYINLSGGVNLYSREAFASRGVKLAFIRSNFNRYHQKTESFIPQLSVIDLLLGEEFGYEEWIRAPFSYSLDLSEA
jgi:hypothetical protein